MELGWFLRVPHLCWLVYIVERVWYADHISSILVGRLVEVVEEIGLQNCTAHGNKEESIWLDLLQVWPFVAVEQVAWYIEDHEDDDDAEEDDVDDHFTERGSRCDFVLSRHTEYARNRYELDNYEHWEAQVGET